MEASSAPSKDAWKYANDHEDIEREQRRRVRAEDPEDFDLEAERPLPF